MSINPFKVVPLPNIQFNKNELIVPKETYGKNDTEKRYDLAGTYRISSSSYYDNNTEAFNAFNGGTSSYWKTNTVENNFEFSPPLTPYTKSPYLVSAIPNAPSVYQGGGTLGSNFFTTKLNTAVNDITKIDGEWLQIELPVLFSLASYSLLTPKPQKNINYFPLEFTVVGSQTGKDGEWWIIDQESFGPSFKEGTGCCSTVAIPDTTNQEAKTFNLKGTDSYKFFRLIITKMPYGTSTVRICQWNLFGKKSVPVDSVKTKQGFTLMNKDVTYHDLNPSTNGVTQFSISEPIYTPSRLAESKNTPLLGTDSLRKKDYNIEYGIFFTLIAVLVGTSMYIIQKTR
jgi:hypothetical protein